MKNIDLIKIVDENHTTTIDTKSLIGIIIVALLLILLLIRIIKRFIDDNKRNKELLSELEQPYFEPQLFEYKVTVSQKYCEVKNYGVRFPETKKEFYVVFSASDGREYKYTVSEEEYLQIEENTTGTLAVVNQNFYGFCPDEN